jgi:uncharacterized protein (TIGR02217 family)
MSNAVFPTLAGLKWPVVKRPNFKTRMQPSASGKEVRASYYSYPVWEFKLSFDLLRADATVELQTLMGFFLSRAGAFDTFLFNDVTDNSVTDQQIGIGTGALLTFQLIRTYGAFIEPIQNTNSVPVIKVNGVTKTVGVDYNIDQYGLVTFVVAPGAGLFVTWTGTFYYRVRFKADTLDFNNFMYQLWELGTCELRGIKL